MSNITLPYSINRIDGHSSSYSNGTFNFSTTINLYKIQPTYLWFQHADQTADIYVDNIKVTTHWGGYNAFFVDITNYIHVGINNIKVALCNTTRNTIAPASGDFNFNATLGKVKLFSSPVLPSMDYGYDGFHITSSNISSSSATITIKTKVPAGGTLICKIDDTSTNYHYKDKKPSTGKEISFTTTISNPILWNGKINPHLYTVTLEIYKNGDLYHRYQRKYGFRTYNYVFNETGYLPNNEPYTGFLLNGSPYYLRGVCMHHDIEGKANALSDEDIAHDFEIIKELGCNFIRLAHYPHPKEVYDWCDELGIIVQTEVPCVNKFQSTMPDDYYTHLYIQYEDMVRQHYNHPCILFWGLSNETSTDDKEFAKTKIEGYVSFIKNLDSERLVGYVLAQGTGQNPSGYYNNPSNVDWFGCNIYVGWYDSPNSNNPTQQINTRLNNTVNASIHKPMAYSEYGCSGTQRCHSANPSSTTTRGSNKPRHDIEYMMWLHEGHIAAIKNFPQLLFTAQWVLFDFAVKSRQEGYTICLDGETTSTDDNLKYLNNKGLVERDHITKKDTFYLYKAWWNQTDKFVHICGKDYEKYTDRVIKCYTNDGNSLRLYVNNNLVETVSVTNNIATFTERNYTSGAVIRVEGNNANDTLNLPDYNPDYNSEYLTFDVKSSGTIKWIAKDSGNTKTISYSKNNGVWTSITSTTSGASISVTTGDKVRFKGTNSTYNEYVATSSTSSTLRSNYFGGTSTFDVFGNIMSLIGGDDFQSVTGFNSDYTFRELFYNCIGLRSAKNLSIKIANGNQCYSNMFAGCSSLTTAPALPATTLASNCYQYMFQNCTNLTTAPSLPATTLASYCYYGMFKGCTGLTTAPVLPATTLASGCYGYMFEGCTSLTTAPELPATTLESSCYSSMFRNCTSLTTAPVLPAAILRNYSYNYMFYGCSSLNYIKCFATNISASYCTSNWVNGVAATGTFIKDVNMTSWTTGATGIPSGWVVVYNDNQVDYLTFDVKSNGTITWKASDTNNTKTISYSKNNGVWTDITSTTSGVSISVTAGDEVRFKGSNTVYSSDSYFNTFGGTATFDVYGNIMSLIGGDNFINLTTLSTTYTFKNLFNSCTGLLSIERLMLPPTTLTDGCYSGMFKGCTNLTTALELPATTLASSCYSGMFESCTSLITAPVLLATTLTQQCYYEMFKDCTSLTTAPVLPAITLTSSCYSGMFEGCTSLTTAPELPAATLTDGCYSSMFNGCSSLNSIICLATDISATNCTNNWVNDVAETGTFVKLSSMTNWGIDSVNGIPEGWTTSVDYSIEYLTFYVKSNGTITWNNYKYSGTSSTKNILYSKNNSSWVDLLIGNTISVSTGDIVRFKGNNSYYGVYSGYPEYFYFNGTSTFDAYGNIMSLTKGDNFKSTKSISSYAFYNLFKSSKLVSAEHLILPVTTLASGCYCEMFKDCTSLTTAPVLPATTLASNCYSGMFEGCTSLTTTPALPATTLAESCYRGMFKGCTGLIIAPVLPVTTLASSCYSSMFEGCTSLTTAPELPATILANYCYSSMFRYCESLNYIKCLATDISATDCTSNWVDGVSTIGIFIKNPSITSWVIDSISGIPSGWILYNDGDEIGTNYYNEYLTFDIKSNGNIIWKASNRNNTKTISYSINDSTWTDITSSTLGTSISVTTGDKVKFKGNNNSYANNKNYYNYFIGTATFDVYGNIMSLIGGDNFTTNNTLISTYAFYGLFSSCSSLLSAENLALPSPNLKDYCYSNMFNSCTNLTTAPIISSLSLGKYCYKQMFQGCTSLITAPTLPAKKIYSGCYNQMFQGCTSLITAPELPATSITGECYSNMFNGCTSLTTAPTILPATTLGSNCYASMFEGCSNLTTAPDLPATNINYGVGSREKNSMTGGSVSQCYANMFKNCTSLITPPIISATTVGSGCCDSMFYGCTSLTTAPVLLSITLASSCYKDMFNGCSSLNYIECLASDTSATNCTSGWVDGVAVLGTFVKNPNMSSWPTGVNGIPSGWTVQDAS